MGVKFRFIQTRNYDINRNYGVDWVTEYIFECNIENLSIEHALLFLKKAGYNPSGELNLKKNCNNIYTLKTINY